MMELDTAEARVALALIERDVERKCLQLARLVRAGRFDEAVRCGAELDIWQHRQYRDVLLDFRPAEPPQ